MLFRDLDFGDVFVFDWEEDPRIFSHLRVGPWIKVSPGKWSSFEYNCLRLEPRGDTWDHLWANADYVVRKWTAFCDFDHQAEETRLLPLGGGGRLIVCFEHYLRERKLWDDPIPEWEELEVVESCR